jgi:hypothetical protein
MRRILCLALSLLAAGAVRSMAAPWTLSEDCSPEDQSKYAQFERAVRMALPGSTVYVPKPYPTTDAQVIQDFLYQYKSLGREKADPKKLPEGELPLLNGILESTVTFNVQKVADWTAGRCGKEQRNYFLYLIRIFDAASRTEISRVTLRASGLWSSKNNSSSKAPFVPLSPPEEATRQVAAVYDIQAEAPQYIVSLGAIYCPWSAPCLAFRKGKDAYVFHRADGLFKIAGAEPRFVLKPGEHIESAHLKEVLPTLRTDGTERLFHLGGTSWTIARQVPRSAGAS